MAKDFLLPPCNYLILYLVVGYIYKKFWNIGGLNLSFLFPIWIGFCLLSSFACFGDVSIRVANLKQDMELVTRELVGLRTEVELLRRENAQLRIQLEQTTRIKSSEAVSSSSSLQSMGNRLQAIESRLTKNEQTQITLQKSIESKIKDLIAQMNKGFDQVQSTNKPAPTPPSFNQDYPQKGFVHKVEKGETISSIAKKYNSKTQWIINANQIVDPKKVFIGKELFIPQN